MSATSARAGQTAAVVKQDIPCITAINHGAAETALTAVESMLAGDDGCCRTEANVPDNASPQHEGWQDTDVLADAFEAQTRVQRVTLYANPVNYRFGHGNGSVLRKVAGRPAPPHHVMRLNSDPVLQDGTIPDFVGALSENRFDSAGRRRGPNSRQSNRDICLALSRCTGRICASYKFQPNYAGAGMIHDPFATG